MRALQNYLTRTRELENEFADFINHYQGNQPILIAALAEKMAHMAFNIGSPISIPEMLKSISEGKLKRWTKNEWNYQKAAPWTTKAELNRKNAEWSYKEIHNKLGYPIPEKHPEYDIWTPERKDIKTSEKGYIEGHFKWNYDKAYIANYDTRDYIKSYLEGNNQFYYKDSIEYRMSIQIASHSAYITPENLLVIDVVTPMGNEYRYFRYSDGTTMANFIMSPNKLTQGDMNFITKVAAEKNHKLANRA